MSKVNLREGRLQVCGHLHVALVAGVERSMHLLEEDVVRDGTQLGKGIEVDQVIRPGWAHLLHLLHKQLDS